MTETPFSLLTMSPALRRALESRRWGKFEGLMIHARAIPKNASLHEEACAVLQHVETHSIAPLPEITRRDLLEDLYFQLGAIVTNPPTPERMLPWLSAAVSITDTIPAAAWGESFTKHAMRRFAFMPAPAQIYDILEEEARDIRHLYARLQLFIREALPYTAPSHRETSHASY